MANKLPKMRLKWNGDIFTLNCEVETKDDETKVIINRVEAAKMIRQFIKKKYGKSVKYWVKSEAYSNGSNVSVWLCKPDGEPVPSSIETEIRGFANSLRAGKFNGMYDSYDYNTQPIYSDLGAKLVMYTQYISVYNMAPYDYKP